MNMKSTLAKAVKPGQSTTGQQASTAGLAKPGSNQVSAMFQKKGPAGGVTEAQLVPPKVDENKEKKRADEAKMQKKEETSEERFMRVQICEQEAENLQRVFKLFVHEQKVLTKEGKGKKELGRKDHTKKDWSKKESQIDGDGESKAGAGGKDPIDEINWFDSKAVRVILNKLGVKEIREQDIEIMIWVFFQFYKEVDENLDGRVNQTEFELMYKKCIEDQMGLEPRNLFNLVQFLMFCKPNEDENGKAIDELDFRTEIKAEDTYFLIYGRLDRQEEQKRKKIGDMKPPASGEILRLLEDEIKLIFRDPDSKDQEEHKTVDPEKTVNYMNYLKRVNKQALLKRQEGKEKRKVNLKEMKE